MPLRPTYPILSDRLSLRPLAKTDVDVLVSYRSLPEVCRYVPFEPMGAKQVAERLRQSWAANSIEKEGDFLTLGAELRSSGELVGDVMLHWSSAEHQSGELGYVFHPHSSGHGYATEAAHCVLHLAFEGLALHRLVARVDVRNAPSTRLLQRIGMRKEAHLVENEWFKGEWSDELDFAMLDREFRARHADGCPYGFRLARGALMVPKRWAGLALLAAAGGYSWLAAGTRPFTWGADLVTSGGFAALLAAFAWRRLRPRAEEPPSAVMQKSVAWIALLAMLALWELVTLFLGNRASFPTLSSLYDSVSRFHEFKASAFLAWLLLGWGLFA